MAQQRKNVRVSTAMRELNASQPDVLRWGKKPGGKESSTVNLQEVITNRDAELARKSEPVKKAQRSSSGRQSRAGRVRTERNSDRVELTFTLYPRDRKMLEEIQQWVDEELARVVWRPTSRWMPDDERRGSEPGTIKYHTPAGWVDNVPAGDYRQMKNGKLPWQAPTARPARSMVLKYARMLRELSFQTTECRLCGKPIKDVDSPEVAQIYKLLSGRFVLPYIKHPLKRGQRELRFRRMHLLHSLWEEELVEVELKLEKATNAEIAVQLNDAIPTVLAEAQKRRPDLTEDDVFESLDEVLAHWEESEESNG